MYNLYDRIKTACEERGMTVSAMCVQLGMSKSVLSDLKSGRKKTLSAETLARIADCLHTSADYLLGKDQPDVLDQVDVAFYGEYKELSDEEKETVRDMVRLMRQRRAQKQKE